MGKGKKNKKDKAPKLDHLPSFKAPAIVYKAPEDRTKPGKIPKLIPASTFQTISDFMLETVPSHRNVFLSMCEYRIRDINPTHKETSESPTHMIIFCLRLVVTEEFHPLGVIQIDKRKDQTGKLVVVWKTFLQDLSILRLIVIGSISPPCKTFHRILSELTKIPNMEDYTGPIIYSVWPYRNIVHLFDYYHLLSNTQDAMFERNEMCFMAYSPTDKITRALQLWTASWTDVLLVLMSGGINCPYTSDDENAAPIGIFLSDFGDMYRQARNEGVLTTDSNESTDKLMELFCSFGRLLQDYKKCMRPYDFQTFYDDNEELRILLATAQFKKLRPFDTGKSTPEFSKISPTKPTKCRALKDPTLTENSSARVSIVDNSTGNLDPNKKSLFDIFLQKVAYDDYDLFFKTTSKFSNTMPDETEDGDVFVHDHNYFSDENPEKPSPNKPSTIFKIVKDYFGEAIELQKKASQEPKTSVDHCDLKGSKNVPTATTKDETDKSLATVHVCDPHKSELFSHVQTSLCDQDSSASVESTHCNSNKQLQVPPSSPDGDSDSRMSNFSIDLTDVFKILANDCQEASQLKTNIVKPIDKMCNFVDNLPNASSIFEKANSTFKIKESEEATKLETTSKIKEAKAKGLLVQIPRDRGSKLQTKRLRFSPFGSHYVNKGNRERTLSREVDIGGSNKIGTSKERTTTAASIPENKEIYADVNLRKMEKQKDASKKTDEDDSKLSPEKHEHATNNFVSVNLPNTMEHTERDSTNTRNAVNNSEICTKVEQPSTATSRPELVEVTAAKQRILATSGGRCLCTSCNCTSSTDRNFPQVSKGFVKHLLDNAEEKLNDALLARSYQSWLNEQAETCLNSKNDEESLVFNLRNSILYSTVYDFSNLLAFYKEAVDVPKNDGSDKSEDLEHYSRSKFENKIQSMSGFNTDAKKSDKKDTNVDLQMSDSNSAHSLTELTTGTKANPVSTKTPSKRKIHETPHTSEQHRLRKYSLSELVIPVSGNQYDNPESSLVGTRKDVLTSNLLETLPDLKGIDNSTDFLTQELFRWIMRKKSSELSRHHSNTMNQTIETCSSRDCIINKEEEHLTDEYIGNRSDRNTSPSLSTRDSLEEFECSDTESLMNFVTNESLYENNNGRCTSTMACLKDVNHPNDSDVHTTRADDDADSMPDLEEGVVEANSDRYNGFLDSELYKEIKLMPCCKMPSTSSHHHNPDNSRKISADFLPYFTRFGETSSSSSGISSPKDSEKDTNKCRMSENINVATSVDDIVVDKPNNVKNANDLTYKSLEDPVSIDPNIEDEYKPEEPNVYIENKENRKSPKACDNRDSKCDINKTNSFIGYFNSFGDHVSIDEPVDPKEPNVYIENKENKSLEVCDNQDSKCDFIDEDNDSKSLKDTVPIDDAIDFYMGYKPEEKNDYIKYIPNQKYFEFSLRLGYKSDSTDEVHDNASYFGSLKDRISIDKPNDVDNPEAQSDREEPQEYIEYKEYKKSLETCDNEESKSDIIYKDRHIYEKLHSQIPGDFETLRVTTDWMCTFKGYLKLKEILMARKVRLFQADALSVQHIDFFVHLIKKGKNNASSVYQGKSYTFFDHRNAFDMLTLGKGVFMIRNDENNNMTS